MDHLPPGSQLLHIEIGAFIPIAIVSGIGIVLSALFIAVNIKYRDYKLLKMTSPNLNLVMLSGAILLFACVVLFGSTAWLPDKNSQEGLDLIWKINHSGVWLASVGFTLFFAPLAAKTWRVHRIFTDAAVKGRVQHSNTTWIWLIMSLCCAMYYHLPVIKDDRLLCFVAALVLLDLGFLGLWLGLDTPVCQLVSRERVPGFIPFVSSTSEADADSPTALPVVAEHVVACASKFTPLWIILMTSYKAALLYYIIYVAWSTRYVTLPSMKDAGSLLISVFVTMTSFCVATPFVTSLYRWPTIQYIVMSCAIFLPVYVVLCLHFVPKILLIRRHTKDEVLTRSFSQYATQRKPEFTEDEIRDLAIQNATLRKEVAEKQRKYKGVLEQLRVAKAKLFEISMLTPDSTDIMGDTVTNDDVVSRSMLTESSPMTSSESDSLRRNDSSKENSPEKKEPKAKRKVEKETSNKDKKSSGSKTNLSLESPSSNDVTIVVTSATSPVEVEKPPAEIKVEEEVISPCRVEVEHSDIASLLPSKDKRGHTRQNSKHRHVSFNDTPSRKEFSNNRLSGGYPTPTHRSQQVLSNGMHTPKASFPVTGKKSWEYYTRGTGYLKYKATVLNHGANGTIAAITGYPVSEPNPNRIVARRNMVSSEIPVFNAAVPVHSTPVLPESTENATELKSLDDEKRKPDFKYFSTSASSRSPSTSTDMTSSAAGHSNDETTSNNNLHPVDHNKQTKDSSSKDETDVPSANSAFTVVKSKAKIPCSGSDDVIVTSQQPCHHHGNKELLYDCYSSGSDSEDYDDSTTSMDSITCELFPPLSPRHRHYLRRYDVMQAKYLAQREKYGRRQKKGRHSEKSEGYSSCNEDTRAGDTSTQTHDTTNSSHNISPKKLLQKSISRKYLESEAKRRLNNRLQRADDGYLYDSITSSDTDSESDWANTATLQKCWERAAQNGHFPLLKAGPITYSHTRKDGIFV